MFIQSQNGRFLVNVHNVNHFSVDPCFNSREATIYEIQAHFKSVANDKESSYRIMASYETEELAKSMLQTVQIDINMGVTNIVFP
jgi:hypothetical protein